VSADSLERGLASEVTRVATAGVTPAELTKSKNTYRTQLITERQQSLFKSEALQIANLFLGDPQAVNADWKRYLAVTVEDIKRVAGRYLRADNALALLIVPEGK
jgi:predicted Zn-dependent peptidase